MVLLKVFKCLLLTFLFLAVSATSDRGKSRHGTLQLVQVIFRHGDRAPTKFYPNDPYINDFDKLWPSGFAQLTNIGKRQHYELGQYLRSRYDGFLSKKYTQKEIYVTSSDMDRTIMSLESNLAGLFPPVENPWHPNIDWQPIPLRTIPRKEDKYLHNYVKCPKYKKLRSNFFSSSPVVLKANQEHQNFIEYCAKHSGLPISTVKGLYPLLDILYAQTSHNYTLPPWAQNGTLEKLLELNAITNTWPTYNDEMKRLSGGPFLQLLLNNMQAVTGWVDETDTDLVVHSLHHGKVRKMVMYSAHDSTLSRIMNTMGIFEPHCPPYASALMIELHKDPDTLEYFIEFHYRNDTTREPYVLSNAKCGQRCGLQNYLDLTQHLIPLNWEKECRLDSDFKDDFFTNPNESLDSGDDDETDGEKQSERKMRKKQVLKSGAPNFRFAPSIPPECYPSLEQLLMLGVGLIISSVFCAFLIVKVLQYRNSYQEMGYGSPLLAGVFGNKPAFYRSTYEKL